MTPSQIRGLRIAFWLAYTAIFTAAAVGVWCWWLNIQSRGDELAALFTDREEVIRTFRFGVAFIAAGLLSLASIGGLVLHVLLRATKC